jgi:hypothetical protein
MKLFGKKEENASSLPDNSGRTPKYVYLWYAEEFNGVGKSLSSVADYIFSSNNVPTDAGIELHPVNSSWLKDAFSNGLSKAVLDTQEYRKKNKIEGFEGFREKILAFTQEGEANGKKWYCLALTIYLKTSRNSEYRKCQD